MRYQFPPFVVDIEERARLRARVCAHGVLDEGGARRCAQARNADVAATCMYFRLGMSVFGSYQHLLKQKTEKP